MDPETQAVWASYNNKNTQVKAGRKVQQAQQQQSQNGGLSGFFKGIGNSFGTLSTGIAEGVNDMTGGNQRAAQQQNQAQQQDISTIKSLGQKIKSATDPVVKQRYQDALAKISTAGDQQTANFQKRQDELVKNTNPSKNVGALLDVGSLAVGGGGVSGGLRAMIAKSAGLGALSSGMAGAGRTLQENPNVNPNELVGNTVGSAVTGGLIGGAIPVGGSLLRGVANIGSKVSNAKGILSKVSSPRVEQAGKNLLGSQADLTRAEARKVGALPGDVIDNIRKRTGLTSLDTATRVADNVTGENGAYSELVRNAIGNGKAIDVTDIRQVADNLMQDKAPLITGSERKNILEQMKNVAISATGGSKGSLTSTADPLTALDKAREFRGMASDIRKGASVSAKDKQIAQVYDEVGKTIEKRLYASPGVEEGLKLAAPDRARELRALAVNTTDKSEASAYSKLADELDNPNLDVKTVRSLQKDFVDAGKIQDYTARAQSGAARKLGGASTGLGKMVQNPLNMLAMPLDAATPKVGGILAKMGQKSPVGIKGVMPDVSPETSQAQDLVKGIFSAGGPAETGARMAVPGAIQQQKVDEGLSSDVQSAQGELGQAKQQGQLIDQFTQDQNTQRQAQQQEAQDPFSDTNIKTALAADMEKTGGKNIDKILLLKKAFGSDATATAPKSPYGKPTAQQHGIAQSGLSSLDQLSGMLSSNPDMVNRTAVPGQDLPLVGGLVSNAIGTGDYNAVAGNVLDALARARTGAAMTSSEEAFYKRLLPRAGDNAETVKTKLSQLREAFQPFVLNNQ